MGNGKSREEQEIEANRAYFSRVAKHLEAVRGQQNEMEVLTKITHFSEQEIGALHELFCHISALEEADELIDSKEFSRALGMPQHDPLMQRMFARFNITRTAAMNFREFVCAMSVLSAKASAAEKIRFSFDIYANRDGMIEHGELKKLLSAALSSYADLNLSDKDVDEICTHTLKGMDLDGNGVIDFTEYTQMAERNPRLLNPFTIPLDKVLAKWADQKAAREQKERETSRDARPIEQRHLQYSTEETKEDQGNGNGNSSSKERTVSSPTRAKAKISSSSSSGLNLNCGGIRRKDIKAVTVQDVDDIF